MIENACFLWNKNAGRKKKGYVCLWKGEAAQSH